MVCRHASHVAADVAAHVAAGVAAGVTAGGWACDPEAVDWWAWPQLPMN
jgi:hypothetical protein